MFPIVNKNSVSLLFIQFFKSSKSPILCLAIVAVVWFICFCVSCDFVFLEWKNIHIYIYMVEKKDK